MNPRTLTESIVREVPTLRADEPVGEAIGRIIESGLPALPVIGDDGKLAGIFGEREFIAAVFPGYLGELKYAGFVSKAIDEQLDRRAECRFDPVRDWATTEHIDVGPDFSDAQLAEIFLHHRVLIVPVAEDGVLRGAITRSDFFRALAQRFAARA